MLIVTISVRQGPLGYYPPQGNLVDTAAMTNQITTLISRFQNAENGLTGANAIIKEILQTVNSVKAKQDNQVKLLKCGLRREGSIHTLVHFECHGSSRVLRFTRPIFDLLFDPCQTLP